MKIKKILIILLCVFNSAHQFVNTMEQTSDTITLVASDGKKFYINKDIIYKFSPLLKEFASVGVGIEQEQTGVIYLGQVDSLVVEFLLKAITAIAPLEKLLCIEEGKTLYFYPFKEVKNTLDDLPLPIYEAIYEIPKNDKMTQGNLLGELLRASTYIDSEILANYFAYKIALALYRNYEKEANQAILNSHEFGYQNDHALELIQNHLLWLYRRIEEYSVADYLLEHGQSQLFEKRSYITLENRQVEDVSLELKDKKITNLFGLDCLNNLDTVTQLNLNNNNIIKLNSRQFQKLKKIRSIVLNNNLLKTIPVDLFAGLQNIVKIEINNNQIEYIPEQLFKSLSHLATIDFSNNKIKELSEGIFSESCQLRLLALSNNQIRTLPKNIFRGLHNLNRLNLSNNKLIELDADIFKDLKQLYQLDLSNNHLQDISADIFLNMRRGISINLKNNPLSSDTKSMLKLLAKQYNYSLLID
ncbi:MAG: leucine-rich repeat protein [Candidatus Dependentiae bacterium]